MIWKMKTEQNKEKNNLCIYLKKMQSCNRFLAWFCCCPGNFFMTVIACTTAFIKGKHLAKFLLLCNTTTDRNEPLLSDCVCFVFVAFLNLIHECY